MQKDIELKHLKLSKPALRALRANNITMLSQLVNYQAQELLSMHGIGPKTITILVEVMKANSMTLKQ